MANEMARSWGELALHSLLKNPFLLASLAVHLGLFYLLGTVALSVNPDEGTLSIPIKLIELGEGRSKNNSIGPDRGPGGPRGLPKLGSAEIPRQSSGRIDAGLLENTTPSKDFAPAAENVSPLPQPKLLADASRARPFAVKETSPDSLVQLPTKDTASNVAPAVNSDPNLKSLAVIRGKGDGEGIRALSEGIQVPGALKGIQVPGALKGIQVPGALKGGGSATGPYGAPGGTKDGKGIRGGGTGTGSGGGSYTGLRGASSADYNQYLKSIEKRVFSVWKYPDGITGVQKVSVRFTLDRAGKLNQVEVLDSTDSRINSSALEAMRRASPFPPIPESLKDLAGESLIIRFTVDIRIRG